MTTFRWKDVAPAERRAQAKAELHSWLEARARAKAIGPAGPAATDALRNWLEEQGFSPMQTEERGDGYFVAKQGFGQAVRYRGGGLLYVQQKLDEVADRLDQLGVFYSVAQRDPEYAVWYPALVVLVDERLGQKLAADSDPPLNA